jgi:gamma-glutamyltranspeptidase/glutathione hydrolase
MVDHVQQHGGCFTSRDLDEYRVIRRRPVSTDFFGQEYLSNPPPSAGGVLIAYGLPLLEEFGVGEPGTAEAIDALARVMREQAQARLGRGGLARALEERAAVVSRGTTHISVVDGKGNAVALTASTGSGSGIVVPGTGIHLNNMIGEFDLAKPPRAGARLSSMMSPSLVLREGRPRLVVGSAGSLRLRGAVMQIVVNVVGHGLEVEDAIDRPRVHLEGDDLHCEGGHDDSELDKLEAMGWNVTRWRRRNLFFGGAAAVTLEDGKLAAAGDPRRGGAGLVVE